MALERAKKKMELESPDNVCTQLLALLSSLPICEEEKSKVLESLGKIVKIYKLKHRD